MENLIEAIRAATASDATPDARAAGAQACRTILAALEATPGKAIETGSQPCTSLQAIVTALRGMPPDQLIDLAITRLKAALPAGTEIESVPRLNVPLIAVPKIGGGK
jgi:hypothetical protein